MTLARSVVDGPDLRSRKRRKRRLPKANSAVAMARLLPHAMAVFAGNSHFGGVLLDNQIS